MKIYNLTKKRKVLILFDDMITDMETNKKLSPIVTELFLSGRKLNISLVFISQFYLKVLQTIRLNATPSKIPKKPKIPNKKGLQQVASNHSPDTKFINFMKHCKYYTKEPYLFLVNDTTFPLNILLRFRKNLL